MDTTEKSLVPDGWSTPPSLSDLKQNFRDSKPYHDLYEGKRTDYLAHLNIEGSVKLKKREGFSSVQPQLIRKHAEWRYAALTEAFLSAQEIYKLHPRTHKDKLTAQQNELLLNYQWNNQLNKVMFVDELVRTAVDEGTVFVRVGWISESVEQSKLVPQYEFYPASMREQVEELERAAQFQQDDLYAFQQHVPAHIQQALQLTEQEGQPIYPVYIGDEEVVEEVLVTNQPTVEVCNSANCFVDPSCNGDLSKAEFFVYSFETSRSALKREGRYSNLDSIKVSTGSVLAAPDHTIVGDQSFEFKDSARQKFVAYEYWGYWDVDGSGVTTPIVVTWVGDTVIRMEANPYPDGAIPFVSTQYLPVRKELYGEPDGALLKDNQAIVGAVTRGAIDLLARSANAQEGMRQDALDAVNKRRYKKGENYEFNPTIGDPRAAIIQHQYPEIPNSVGLMLTLQNNEAESITGVKPYSGGMSGDALGKTATGVRGVLDAATKRETGILRRFAKIMMDIGKKIVAMNGEFLSDEEVIRITDEDFVAIRREELRGNYDIEVAIATAEEDNAKAEELAFMLQTMGNTLPMEMSQIVLADIARLRKMPTLAKRIEDYKPQPDPTAEMAKQMEMQKLQLENQKLQMEIAQIQTTAQLNQAKTQETMVKAGNTQSDTDLKNLDFVEQQDGIKHARDIAQNKAQAEGNMALEILKADLAKDNQVS